MTVVFSLRGFGLHRSRGGSVVLTHVLAVQPAQLIVPELVREIDAGVAEFAEDDALERAVRDLTGLGLLRCPGGIVMPTRAADSLQRASGGLSMASQGCAVVFGSEPEALP